MNIVILNDTPREVVPDQTVAELLSELVLPARGIAVAVNGEVVRRGDWPTHHLRDGDRVEVLSAAQGG
ncbi:thiamine biosynthesis protein ThiS [Rhizocola hellebori]|uniref:Thiamine biosynthesis protein ThiS n=1 Tax=Rhizocola hellebori TaxID=1392758 RepID=A0A8J3Q5T2_9ACTN|nr:sulfur carrier protein ThiS [Rhizocola hellebori]GIH04321.1 thiamine biosynthesis protein ThiS [Rhizocola hellebori]